MNHAWIAAAVLAAAAAGAARAADIVVITHPGAGPLTKAQIADVYLGKDQSFTPVDQPEAAPIRAEFYRKLTGRELAQIKATWSRLIFSGNGQAPKELPDSEAVKKAVAANPKGIGYIDKAALDATVKAALTVE